MLWDIFISITVILNASHVRQVCVQTRPPSLPSSLQSCTHSFFLADFLFSSLTSWLGSRSLTSGSSVRLAGMMSSSRSLLSCANVSVVHNVKVNVQNLRAMIIQCVKTECVCVCVLTSELTPRLLSRLSLYLPMRSEKSRYLRSTVLTQRFSSDTWAWPFSTRLSASWISSFTFSLVCCGEATHTHTHTGYIPLSWTSRWCSVSNATLCIRFVLRICISIFTVCLQVHIMTVNTLLAPQV